MSGMHKQMKKTSMNEDIGRFGVKRYSKKLNLSYKLTKQNNKLSAVFDDGVFYGHKEIKVLNSCNTESLQMAHKIKKEFGGWIIDSQNNGDN